MEADLRPPARVEAPAEEHEVTVAVACDPIGRDSIGCDEPLPLDERAVLRVHVHLPIQIETDEAVLPAATETAHVLKLPRPFALPSPSH